MSLPEPVAGVRWRTGRAGDVDVLTAVQAAADRVDEPGHVVARTDAEMILASVEAEQALVVGERGGEAVAVGVLFRPGRGPVRLGGAVVPEARGEGIGRALLAHQLARAAELHPDAPACGLRSMGDGGVAALARRFGFERARFFLTMRRDLTEAVPSRPLPEDLRIVPLATDLDEPLRLVKNEVFRDHWNGIADEPQEWRTRTLGPRLIRDLSRVALDADGTIAGFVVVWRTVERPQQAYIDLVGTTREQRGRGVAGALLATTLAAAVAAGFREAELDVDASSPTGAGRVYEGVGFREVRRSTVWQREQIAAGATSG
jgi:ribosomal protein S18 acetylase RimI-like enzyme